MTRPRLTLILPLAFLVLATFYSVTNPPFESPDEVGHFAYVLHLLTDHALPRQRANDLGEAQQPPLYYVVAAVAALPSSFRDPTGSFDPNPAFIWGSSGGREINAGHHGSVETFPFAGQALTLHLAREASVLMGAVTIWLIVLIGWEIFPERPAVGILAGLIAAFDPQFLFISASVNNDNLLAMTATGAIWQMVRMVGRPT
ncbi:MAG: glycosyltransferase family 39 protein, partial [Chloroflexota bacterium]